LKNQDSKRKSGQVVFAKYSLPAGKQNQEETIATVQVSFFRQKPNIFYPSFCFRQTALGGGGYFALARGF
jgi:hypothetical protein